MIYGFIAELYLSDKSELILTPEITETPDGFILKIPAEKIPKNTDYIDISAGTVIGKVGDTGYFVMPGQHSDFLCEFKAGKDHEQDYTRYSMPIFGQIRPHLRYGQGFKRNGRGYKKCRDSL